MAHSALSRAASFAAAAVLGLGLLAGTAHSSRPSAQRAPTKPKPRPTLFVHGYQENAGLDCADTWARAREYFEQQGHDPQSLRTIGYYRNDTRCGDQVAQGTVNTPITELAAGLAWHIHQQYAERGQPVDVLAHSMGGVVARTAMLGSAQGWVGFPHEKLPIANMTTLATPYQGVREADRFHNRQWDALRAGSDLLQKLHAPHNRLDQPWAAGTRWILAGSDEDGSVSGNSALDRGFHADHKYRYLRGGNVDHVSIIELLPDAGPFPLRFWHASDGVVRETQNGSAPLEAVHRTLDQEPVG